MPPRLVLGALGAAVLLCAPAAAAAAPQRIVVELEPHASSAERAAARSDAGTGLVRTLGRRSFQLVAPHAGQTLERALAALRADPSVRAAAPDGYGTLASLPDDPLLSQQWGLQAADVPAAWDRTVGSPSIVVADVDSGYRFDDPDLGPVAWTNPGEIPGNGVDDDHDGYVDDVHGWDFVGANADSPAGDADPTDDDILSGGHGLHTAGILGAAGNNGVGISGVAQNVHVMPLRVCSDSPSNSHAPRCPFSAMVAAINYAGAHGARVANLSIGGTRYSALVRDALASNSQTLYVIAADNSTEDDDVVGHYPCDDDPTASGIPGAIDNTICVAAVDPSGALSWFSDWGARTVDLGAPGSGILSTYLAQPQLFGDDFETATAWSGRWTATGADGGFERTNAAPLTSYGMSVTTGAHPGANLQIESTSAQFLVPPGSGSCTLYQHRNVSTDADDVYTYYVLKDGSPTFTSIPVASGAGSVHTNPILGLAGHEVQLRFRFTTGSAPATNRGVWLDDIRFTCYAPSGTPLTYVSGDGTSMAAPHVSGAAGLLFSLDPEASVTQVKDALLSSARPDPALAGKTTSGGTLDVAAALNRLVPPSPPLAPAPPAGSTSSTHHRVICVVPRLARKTLAQARRALARAHCRLGRVRRPKARHHHRLPPLVVKASKPRAHAHRAARAKVALTLEPKPKRRRHARR